MIGIVWVARRGCTDGENNVRLKGDQLGCEVGKDLVFSFRGTALKGDILSFDVSEIPQSLCEGLERFRCHQGPLVRQYAHQRNLRRLLGVGRERPRQGHRAEQADEVATPHSISSWAKWLSTLSVGHCSDPPRGGRYLPDGTYEKDSAKGGFSQLSVQRRRAVGRGVRGRYRRVQRRRPSAAARVPIASAGAVTSDPRRSGVQRGRFERIAERKLLRRAASVDDLIN
jgi:hypothetical protein